MTGQVSRLPWVGVRPRALGAWWMVLAAAAFALMGVCVKLGASRHGPFEILFWRTLLGALVLSGLMALRGQSPRTPHLGAHAKRALIGYASMGMLFYALANLPLSTAITLNYTSSLFFVLLCVAKLGDRPSAALLGALALGFSGVIVLLQPSFSSGLWWPTLIGLGSGICAGFAVFQVRELGQLGEPAWRTVFWFFWIASGVGALLLALGPGFSAPDAASLTALAGVAVSGLAGQLCMTRAYREGRRFAVASLAYLTVVFSALLGFVLWGEPLGAASVAAMAMVIASGVLAARLSR